MAEHIIQQQETSSEILHEEKKIIEEERNILRHINRDTIIITGAVVLLIALSAGYAVWQNISSRVYIDKAELRAPQIELSSRNGGVLREVMVNEGDMVLAHTPVARVGDELIKTEKDGLVIITNKALGQLFAPGQAVVTMIESKELRVIGRIEEDKGLDKIMVGQRAVFTFDALGSREFVGAVDEISPASLEAGLSFSISDKRPTKEFLVKVLFDASRYPELKNGMSARLWIYIK